MRTIEEIAKERAEAKQAYDCVCMINVSGASIERRIELDVAYAKAQSKFLRLDGEYKEWIANQLRP